MTIRPRRSSVKVKRRHRSDFSQQPTCTKNANFARERAERQTCDKGRVEPTALRDRRKEGKKERTLSVAPKRGRLKSVTSKVKGGQEEKCQDVDSCMHVEQIRAGVQELRAFAGSLFFSFCSFSQIPLSSFAVVDFTAQWWLSHNPARKRCKYSS